MSPINFKLFKQAVEENLVNYELKHGKINISGTYSKPALDSVTGGKSTSAQDMDEENVNPDVTQSELREQKNDIIVEE
jgi:hypothetical protein